MKKPETDEECRNLLKNVCNRNDEQIDAIFEYAKLVKDLNKEEK